MNRALILPLLSFSPLPCGCPGQKREHHHLPEAFAAIDRLGCQAFVLDGDNLRHGLNANLGFSPADRAENIRRAGEAAALFAQAGFIVIAAFISPYRADRDRARAAAQQPETAGFHEVYVRADLATCERRDPKGLYARARAGLIPESTDISAPVEQSAAQLLDHLKRPPCPSGSLLVYSHAEKGRRGGTSPAVPRQLILA